MVAKTLQHKVVERARLGKRSNKPNNGTARTRIGLNAIACETSPWRTQCNARVVPQPGHLSPVSMKTGQRGKKETSSGLNRKSTAAQARAMATAINGNSLPSPKLTIRPLKRDFHSPLTKKLIRSGRHNGRNDCRTNPNEVNQPADYHPDPHPR